MAVIQLPQDPRQAAIAQVMGAFTQALDAQAKSKQMQDALQSGQDISQLPFIAGQNPQAQELVKQLVESRKSQALTNYYGAEAQRAQEEAISETTKRQKDMGEVAKSLAEVQYKTLQGQVEQARTRQIAAEAQMNAATSQSRLAEADKFRADADKARVEADQASSGLKVMQSLFPDAFGQPTGGGGQTVQTQPSSWGAASAPAPRGPVTPLDQDMLSIGLPKIKAEADRQTRMGGFTPSVKAGGVTMSMKTTPINDKEQTALTDAMNLAQTLKMMQDTIVQDKDGKLKLGPISGAVQQILNKYKQNPAAANDPNILMDVLGGHEFLSTFSGLGSSPRSGYMMSQQIRSVLASMKDGKAFDLAAIKQSMRILRNMTGNAALTLSNRKAQGINPEVFEEIDRLTREGYEYDPTKGEDVTIGDKTFSRADIRETAQKYNQTEQEVIDNLTDAYKPKAGAQ